MADFIRFENVSFTYNAYEVPRGDTYNDAAEHKKASESDIDCNLSDGGVPSEAIMAVSNANFVIKKGEFVSVIGRNGSGKSTIAKMMNALLLPTEGSVYISGIDTRDENKLWDIRRQIGMVFQNPDNQIIGATVEDDIAFGLENIGIPHDEMLAKIDEAIKTVKLENERRTEPHMLSGGQKQRCAIAGIVAMSPECIVFDEATAMLDPIGRREIMSLAHRLNKEHGITIINITHHMDEACGADRAILIDRGRILADMAPGKLFANKKLIEDAGLEMPQITELIYILNQELRPRGISLPDDVISVDNGVEVICRLLSEQCKHEQCRNAHCQYLQCQYPQCKYANITEGKENNADNAQTAYTAKAYTAYKEKTECKAEATSMTDGQSKAEAVAEVIAEAEAEAEAKAAAIAIAAEHISYTYMKGTPFEKKALNDVSFEIPAGSLTGIIGHTGCGKSTLIQHFNGLLRQESGKLYINGELIDKTNIKQIRKRTGLVFQYPEYQLFESTVYKDIAFGIKSEKLTKEEEQKRVLEAASKAGLSEEILEKSIYELSGGQKRRAAIAGILVMKPEILVLDEPAAGLDPAGRNEILRLAKKLCTDDGNTVVLVSHSMEDIARLADYIIVMNNGSIDMSGTPREIFKNEEHLNKIGLTVPQMTSVFHKIAQKFPEINKDIFTVEEAAYEIMRNLNTKEAAGEDAV